MSNKNPAPKKDEDDEEDDKLPVEVVNEEDNEPEDNEPEDTGDSEDDDSSDDTEDNPSEEAAGSDNTDAVEKHPGDEEPDASASEPETQEEKRIRRKKERSDRRDRVKREKETDRLLIASLTSQLATVKEQVDGLGTRSNQADMVRVDDSISSAQKVYENATRAMEIAISKNNGKAHTAALNARDGARDRYNELVRYKQSMSQSSTQQQQPTYDPQVIQQAQAFSQQHKWYDVMGRDEDSQVMLTIDQSLIRAGYDPKTEGYWQELRNRGKKYLPHRFEAPDKQDPAGRRRPRGKPGDMAGASRGVQGTKTMSLSKERREALVTMGYQPGSKAWNTMVRKYQGWDKEHKGE